MQTLPQGAQSIMRGGYLAVQTFFLLSGFVLAQSYATTRWNRRSLTRFADRPVRANLSGVSARALSWSRGSRCSSVLKP